jgi:hypothetical protein
MTTPVMINSPWHTEMLGDLVVAGLSERTREAVFRGVGTCHARPNSRNVSNPLRSPPTATLTTDVYAPRFSGAEAGRCRFLTP